MSSRPAKRHAPCKNRACQVCYPTVQLTSKAELEVLQQKIVEIVEKNPEKASLILADWVNGVQRKSANKKKIA
jgi:flagellar biosynthesis/type III secretory pathway M-ring protein FliF/YscJ